MMEDNDEYCDIGFLSNNHAIELSNKLARNTNVRRIIFYSSQNTTVTNEGLTAIAQSMRDLPELQTIYVDSSLSGEATFEVIKVLYLEGNLQRLDEICIDNERAQFLFDCFRVGQNDTHIKQVRIESRRSISVPIEFAACLHGNTHLQKLRVDIDVDFTPNDASVLAAAMCDSQLTELHICNYQHSNIKMKGILLRILCRDGIQASGRIWECLEIDAYYARVDDMSPVADVIPYVKTLRMLKVGRQLQPKDNMHCLFEGLERSCNLVCLELVHCQLDSNDMRMLCRALRHHRSLKKLDIAHNNIGDAGVSALIEHWDEHPILESLNVERNQIGPTGILQLVNAVVSSPSMKVLKMGHNEIGCSGLQMIGEQLPNLRLKVLDLYKFSGDIHGDKQRAYQSLLRGLKANYFIHKLDIPEYFGEEFGNELLFYVALSEHRRYLVTDINAVAPTIWCTILAKCGSHYSFSNSMVFYFLRQQPHLVRRAQSMMVVV